MAETAAIPMNEFLGSMCTDDGRYVLVKGKNSSGEFNVAIQLDQVLPMLAALSVEAGKAQRKKTGDTTQIHMFHSDWFDIGWAADHMVFSFQVAEGQKLHFRLNRGMERNFLEVLKGVLEGSAPPQGGTPQ